MKFADHFETSHLRADIAQRATSLHASMHDLVPAAEAQRDHEALRDLLEASGLLALRLPEAIGGLGGSQSDALTIVRLLARVDAGIAQLLQPHFSFSDILPWMPSDAARATVEADILAGGRIANAASERGGKHSADFKTILRKTGDRYVISGTKYYATGSLGARWFTVIGLSDAGQVALAFVRADAPGMQIRDDWNGMGQIGSGSGTLILEDVEVDAGQVYPLFNETVRPVAWHESTRFIHAAIDQGIAEGALAWGAEAAANSTRVPFELPFSSLAEDPVLQFQLGQLSARVMATGALLERSGALLDVVQTSAATERLPELRQALLATKAMTADISLDAATEAFSWIGARAADRSLHSDRFWRNARTHTLHDPVRLRYLELGRAQLDLHRADRADQPASNL